MLLCTYYITVFKVYTEGEHAGSQLNLGLKEFDLDLDS